jgi:predicted MFS family arabinose efflux permease
MSKSIICVASAQLREPERPLSGFMTLLFAVACGLSVANVYCAQPLLDSISRDLQISQAVIGVVVTVTQIGYGLGLLFVVPLGDLLDRRQLLIVQGSLSVLALLAVSFAPTGTILLTGMFAVGLLAVAVQVLVSFAATLASPSERGKTVGTVTSGVVLGILMARFVAGVLADAGGWRIVFGTSAILMLIMTVVLSGTLPCDRKTTPGPSYLQLLRSMFVLFLEEPVFRTRAVLALLIFATFSVLWTSMVLPLSGLPFALSHTKIGLFGMAGVAGALAAARAGHFADKGWGQWTTGISLSLMLIAWIPIAFVRVSIWMFVIGIVILDLAIQAVHVTNQSMIFAVRPEARSRLVGGYMFFYSIGSASGSISSTMVYAQYGWLGVCLLGAAISTLALAFWALHAWRGR